jgi:hypothetical protein
VCDGSLTCDQICHRCRQNDGGPCATDTDCATGFVCYEWKCTAKQSQWSPEPEVKKKSDKHVKFVEPES